MTSTITRAAAFACAVPNFLAHKGMPPPLESIPYLYYCDPVEGKDPLGRIVEPGLLVDISSQLELKAQMLAAHASQRDWLHKHHGMDHYVESMRQWCASRGQLMSPPVAFAEGFRQHFGHSYPQDDQLGQLLRSKA
jgi:LmbE family N-acetylglucosaminyl deacetylase